MTHTALTDAERFELYKNLGDEKEREHYRLNAPDHQIIYEWAKAQTCAENGKTDMTYDYNIDYPITEKKVADFHAKREMRLQDGKSVSTETQEQEPFDYLAMLDSVHPIPAEPQKGEQHDASTKNSANTLRVQ
jgi:hypothetical protein